MEGKIIYTIGHSTHPADYFLKLLQQHGINCIVDVRSVAASRFNPQYNKKALTGFLESNRVKYLHFEQEFGARQTNPALLDEEGRVDFDRIRDSEKFREGIARLEKGAAKGYVIALMCSESEPLDCHRFSMISPALAEKSFTVKHILKNGLVVRNEKLEEKLLQKFESIITGSGEFSSGLSGREKTKISFHLQNKKIGYVPGKNEP